MDTVSIPKWLVPTVVSLVVGVTGYVVRSEVSGSSQASAIAVLERDVEHARAELKELQSEKNGLSQAVAAVHADVKNLVRTTEALVVRMDRFDQRLTEQERRRRR